MAATFQQGCRLATGGLWCFAEHFKLFLCFLNHPSGTKSLHNASLVPTPQHPSNLSIKGENSVKASKSKTSKVDNSSQLNSGGNNKGKSETH